MEEDIDQDEDEGLMWHSAPEAGDSNGKEPPSQATGMEPAEVPGTNIGGDDGQEPSNQTTTETPAEEVPAKPGGGHDDDQEPSILSAEAGATEGTTTHESATPMLGWGGANLREDRDNWGGVVRPGWGGGGGVPPTGWAQALPPVPAGDAGADHAVSEPEGYT